MEKVAEKCKDLPRDKRVTVKVARFSVSSKSTQAHATFGDELSTMLTSAIQQTNCFRVLETNKNTVDATDEMAFNQDGFTNGTGPKAGEMTGTQLIVTGEITDFTEGTKNTSLLGVSVGSNQATLGFTLKLLDPQKGEILFSKDINMKGSSSGFSGVKMFGLQAGGKTENRAVQDALQKAIIKAVEVMVDARDKIEMPEPMKAPVIKKFSPQNCSMLRNGSPKIMILITEATTGGTNRDNSNTDIARRERELQLKEKEASINNTNAIITGIFGRKNSNENSKKEETASKQNLTTAVYKTVTIEQSATETELTRHFVEAGFRVIDPKMFAKMRQKSDSLGADMGGLAAEGLKMGANIVITGQAISERTSSQGSMANCRARLEIKAIATEDGSILATNTISAGGMDVSEVIANKVALQRASFDMSQYLMNRLCGMNIQFAGSPKMSNSLVKPTSGGNSNMTEIVLQNVNFAQLQAITNFIKTNNKVKEVRKSLSGKEGHLEIDHTTNTDTIAEFLSTYKTYNIEVTGMESNRIEASLK
ncbi:CsgG/HfaB family protein [Arcicella sp. LKC2W]|uniref:CsgG/HfaB family protein n=1 Tax=Arcicella sp. LKC2W TaxID=2984198 RepID=UPI002B210386|nr:CsgG/HfaB family protein [Arcicella sp. LKC2W]MEA5461054.1 CsgG/HfaB family protein [Arcicella sp. LKC2W]